ncbi:EamA-like transporter family protein [Cupriavidus sp. YR651]|uniref:EamA family transporter n=1 Tax=Cupriavidus sp. YR651 TaxID=1855315 RepID=UPI0008839C0D|nr:EamA family transporter [Cupriavidus sp. YR651]SDC22230.1 EamA-like transporter family protein [Cupriavidus sp. YR651]
MKVRPLDYLWIFLTISLTVYGQIILKWRMERFGGMPAELAGKALFVLRVLTDPGVFSGILSAFLASVCWIVAMTKFELSHAYPFVSLCFVAVTIASVWLFGEQLSLLKIAGVAFIVFGTILASQG